MTTGVNLSVICVKRPLKCDGTHCTCLYTGQPEYKRAEVIKKISNQGIMHLNWINDILSRDRWPISDTSFLSPPLKIHTSSPHLKVT